MKSCTIYLLMPLCVLIGTTSFGQQFEWLKETWINGSGKMSISPQQYLYVEGTYPHILNTVNGVSLNNLGYPHVDLYVAKYNLDGDLLWVRSTSNGSNADYIDSHAHAFDQLGNIYITGYFHGDYIFDDITLSSGDGERSDMFIVKYDVDGNLIWAKNYGSYTESDFNYVIQIDRVGNSYVLVKGVQDFKIGDLTIENPDEDYDYNLLLKLDTNGDYLWHAFIKGYFNASLVLDKNEEIHIGLSFQNDLIWPYEDTIYSQGEADIVFCHYSQDGLLLEKTHLKSQKNIDLAAFEIDTTNNLFAVIGVTPGHNVLIGANEISIDTLTTILLAKFDYDYTLIWSKSINIDSTYINVKRQGLHFDSDQNLLIFVVKNDTNNMYLETEGVYLLQLNSSNGEMIDEQYLDNFNGNIFDFDLDFNLYTLGGHFDNEEVLGVFVTSPTEGIHMSKINKLLPLPYRGKNDPHDLSIYPVPTQNGFNIRQKIEDDEAIIFLNIYSINGEKIFEDQLTNKEIWNYFVQTSTWPAGIYLGQLIVNEELQGFKIVKI
jgi:hypothetical protein